MTKEQLQHILSDLDVEKDVMSFVTQASRNISVRAYESVEMDDANELIICKGKEGFIEYWNYADITTVVVQEGLVPDEDEEKPEDIIDFRNVVREIECEYDKESKEVTASFELNDGEADEEYDIPVSKPLTCEYIEHVKIIVYKDKTLVAQANLKDSWLKDNKDETEIKVTFEPSDEVTQDDQYKYTTYSGIEPTHVGIKLSVSDDSKNMYKSFYKDIE